LRSPYDNNCTPIISPCQEVFLWYSIAMRDKVPKLAMFLRRILEAVKDVKKSIQENTKAINTASEEANHQKIDSKNVVAEVHFDENTIKATNAENDRSDRRQKEIRNATIAAVVAACIYAATAACQLQQMSIQTSILNGQVTTVHKDSLEAIGKAGAQVDMAKQTMRVDQRAWIGIVATKATVEVNIPLAVGLKLQQLGKTPARHCELQAKVETAENESRVRFEFKKGEIRDKANMETILPNAIINVNVQEPDKLTKQGLVLKNLTKPRFEAINRGDVQFFVHGKVTYDDAFAIHHWVEFCFFYQPNPILRTTDVPFINCEHHNDIDDDLE